MTSPWPHRANDHRPTSWTLSYRKQLQGDPAPAGPQSASPYLGAREVNDENDGIGGPPLSGTMSGIPAHLSQDGRDDQRDRSSRRHAPPPLPLHERTSSGSNRLSGIRVVPYSPPRLGAQLGAQGDWLSSGAALELATEPTTGPATSGSPSRSPQRRRRQRQRRHRSRDTGGVGEDIDINDDDDNDSDCTATTITSKRTSRPVSWASRGSWGPATALKAASAIAGALPSSSAPGSPGSSSKASSSRTVVGSGLTGKARNEGNAGSTALTEKSRNLVMAGNLANATKKGNDGRLGKEGYAAIRPGSALSTPSESVFPLARGSSRGVSVPKLASPTGSQASATAPTVFPSATPGTPATSANVTSNTSNIRDVNATSRLLAHRQQEQEQHHQHPQQPRWQPHFQPQQGGPASHSSHHDDGSHFEAQPARPGASASADQASFASNAHRLSSTPSSPIAIPTSPSSSATYFLSSYQLPPTIATSTAASSTLTGRSLSPSPSLASLTSVSSSQVAPRPSSRRQNLIAVHADKTFSLVPREPGGLRSSATSPSSLFVYPDQPLPTSTATTISSLKSPPLSFVSTTLRSSSSHERLSSDAFSGDDHPSSPLTTAASLPDRSSLSPFTLSPGSSTIHLTADPIPLPAVSDLPPSTTTPSNTASPWNYRLAGGVRKVPKTPDFKAKGKGRAVPSTYSYSQKHHAVISGLDVSVLPPLSESSSPTTTIVAGGTRTAVDAAATSSAFASSRSAGKKPSFASDKSAGALSTSSSHSFSASTVSAATNYKVYAHSSSPAGAASESVAFDSSALESSDSLGQLPSSRDSTNIEILGISSPAAPPLPVLQRSDDPDQTFPSLASYPSISSFDTGISASSSAPNVLVLGASSPPAPSRYLEHAQNDGSDSVTPAADFTSSPPLPPRTATTTTDSLETTDSDQNYVLHGEPSSIFLAPESSSPVASPVAAPAKAPRPVFSQESLIVPPLKTVRSKRSNERLGYYRSRSRESLRRAASIKSISSIFTQDAANTFFAGQAFLNITIPPVPVISTAKTALIAKPQQRLPAFVTKTPLPRRKPLPLPAPIHKTENYVVYSRTPNKDAQNPSDSWDSSSPPPRLTSTPPSPTLPEQPKRAIPMVDEHAHQWSSQLSTVMSESEVDSIDLRSVSRSLSAMSGAPSGSGVRGDVSPASGMSARRSSTGWASSTHSRNMPSITSSLGLQLDEMRDRNSRSDSLLLDRPNPVFLRTSSASPATSASAAPPPPPIRTVRDLDEHGDGLADLHDIMRQPSRTGLSGFFGSSNNSARNLHSSSSMRSVRSMASGAFPSWARVYYGSGEHRALSVAPSMSDIGEDYYGPGPTNRRSPSVDNMPLNIYNARRRPREIQPGGVLPMSDIASMEAEGGLFRDYRVRPLGLRKMTSSIWSPHLRVDRRATRFSVWEPPSGTWSTESSSAFDRRNIQVICFTAGFIFPFGKSSRPRS